MRVPIAQAFDGRVAKFQAQLRPQGPILTTCRVVVRQTLARIGELGDVGTAKAVRSSRNLPLVDRAVVKDLGPTA